MNATETRMQSRRHFGLSLLAGAMLLPFSRPGLAETLPLVKVWKDPSCGCCGGWIEHMRAAGFKVKSFDTGNADERARLGIDEAYGSCHTAQIGDYAIEGHVPAEDIKRLLREAPKARGLALPGMKVGSPGMDGPLYGGRKDPYEVLLIKADGSSEVFQAHR